MRWRRQPRELPYDSVTGAQRGYKVGTLTMHQGVLALRGHTVGVASRVGRVASATCLGQYGVMSDGWSWAERDLKSALGALRAQDAGVGAPFVPFAAAQLAPEHEAPTLSCTCGFYAYHARSRAMETLAGIDALAGRSYGLLEVSITGEAIEYPSGWRYETQSIERVTLLGACLVCLSRKTRTQASWLAYYLDADGFDAWWGGSPRRGEAGVMPVCSAHLPEEGRGGYLSAKDASGQWGGAIELGSWHSKHRLMVDAGERASLSAQSWEAASRAGKRAHGRLDTAGRDSTLLLEQLWMLPTRRQALLARASYTEEGQEKLLETCRRASKRDTARFAALLSHLGHYLSEARRSALPAGHPARELLADG